MAAQPESFSAAPWAAGNEQHCTGDLKALIPLSFPVNISVMCDLPVMLGSALAPCGSPCSLFLGNLLADEEMWSDTPGASSLRLLPLGQCLGRAGCWVQSSRSIWGQVWAACCPCLRSGGWSPSLLCWGPLGQLQRQGQAFPLWTSQKWDEHHRDRVHNHHLQSPWRNAHLLNHSTWKVLQHPWHLEDIKCRHHLDPLESSCLLFLI